MFLNRAGSLLGGVACLVIAAYKSGITDLCLPFLLGNCHG